MQTVQEKREVVMGSVLSFPDRGPWGDSSYHGNCSGHVFKELYERLRPKLVVDPMMGSGTSIEVAQAMGIDAVGLDLRLGFDALTMSILEKVGRPACLVLSHPPYGGQVLYSGNVWGDKAHPSDLSHAVDDEDFNAKLQAVLLNQREATRPGGHYGTIIGDWRRGGKYSSFQAEAIGRMPSSELVAVLIKQQHNVRSGAKQYGRMVFPRIEHEYILLWQKSKQVMCALQTLGTIAREQQQRVRSTWRSVVRVVMAELGGESDLKTLYGAIAANAPEKLRTNTKWQEKTRQTLQLCDDFESVERGVWRLRKAA